MTAPAAPQGLFARPRLKLIGRLGSIQLWIGLVMLALLLGAAVWFSIDPPEGGTRGNLLRRFRAPGVEGYPLGTDQMGRNLLARVMAGLPWSMGIACTAAIITSTVGALAGLFAAFRAGWSRIVIRQLIDTVIAFPGLVIAVTVIALVGRGFWPVALTLGISAWPIVARVVFAEAQGVLQRDYVRAARLFGVSGPMILWVHVLPALRPTLLVMFAFIFADMLIIESALSFLGLGAPLTAPTWGNILSESRQYLINAPWMMLVPAGAIVTAVMTFNLIGDGISEIARRRGRAIET